MAFIMAFKENTCVLECLLVSGNMNTFHCFSIYVLVKCMSIGLSTMNPSESLTQYI